VRESHGQTGGVSSLFDDFERTDASWATYGEDSFHFLNRAAGPFWATVRDELERWFQAYPSAHAADLRSRFRKRSPDQHEGAWWELYLFRVFTALGFEVEVHPEVATAPGRPDFRLGGERPLYVEATTVFSGIVEEGRHRERESWILDALNEGKSANFFVWIDIEKVGMERPTIREVVGPVEGWLDSLDPDAVEASRSAGQGLPTCTFPFRDWRIRLRPIPKRPERRGNPAHRLVGVGPMSIGFVNDRDRVRRALDNKRRQHAKVDAPLILAVLGMSPVLDQEDVAQALFGSEAVEVDSLRLIRKPDGFWRGPRGASATAVSAALIGSGIRPWALSLWPRLWLNPWADRPLQTELPFPSAHVEAETLVFTDETRAALGLPPDWPGDPESRFDPTGD
jgi:hypothetical protein